MPSVEIVNRTTRGGRAPYNAMVNPLKSIDMPKRKLLNTSATTKNPMVRIPTAQYQSGDFLIYAYSGASHEMVSGNEVVACSVGTCGILASLAHKNKSLHRKRFTSPNCASATLKANKCGRAQRSGAERTISSFSFCFWRNFGPCFKPLRYYRNGVIRWSKSAESKV